MKQDVRLLMKYNLMDYSLLMCIQENPDYVEYKKTQLTSSGDLTQANSRKLSVSSETLQDLRSKFKGNRHKFLSTDGKYIYHIGIIDYLQDYNFEKKMENFLKYTVLMKGAGISAVEPPTYGERFLRFMRDHVIVDQKRNPFQNKDFLRLSRPQIE